MFLRYDCKLIYLMLFNRHVVASAGARTLKEWKPAVAHPTSQGQRGGMGQV